MFSPRPYWFFLMRFSRPSPKAMSSATETVPQVMPSSVRSVRTFWCRTSCRICLRKERDVIVVSDAFRPQAAAWALGRIRSLRSLAHLPPLLDLLGRPLHHQVGLL